MYIYICHSNNDFILGPAEFNIPQTKDDDFSIALRLSEKQKPELNADKTGGFYGSSGARRTAGPAIFNKNLDLDCYNKSGSLPRL